MIYLKNIIKVKQGKKNRASGSAWERKVREDLESKGWIVDRWGNNVEFTRSSNEKGEMLIEPENTRLVQSKAKYNPFTKSLMMSKGGFPDFIVFGRKDKLPHALFNGMKCERIIGVECKSNGYLDKVEKEKCKWLLDNKIFGKILIAKKKKSGRRVIIEYVEF